ncbi:WhiB family transcriptional regulator [Streptomyces murinus]
MAYTGSVPDTAVRRLDWMDQMACRDVDPELFEDDDQEHEARTICIARCPVRSQCLARVKTMERGKHRDQRDGVVAGLTYVERHRLDADAPHHQGDAEVLKFDGTERCGTHLALLRHLWLDEPIDSKCWSGKVKRDRKNRGAASDVARAVS